jgi:hypothetical protein
MKIDNQSMKVAAKQAIDYSLISNINRLINIDWY